MRGRRRVGQIDEGACHLADVFEQLAALLPDRLGVSLSFAQVRLRLLPQRGELCLQPPKALVRLSVRAGERVLCLGSRSYEHLVRPGMRLGERVAWSRSPRPAGGAVRPAKSMPVAG
jgi:hypothetical protein